VAGSGTTSTSGTLQRGTPATEVHARVADRNDGPEERDAWGGERLPQRHAAPVLVEVHDQVAWYAPPEAWGRDEEADGYADELVALAMVLVQPVGAGLRARDG
jgi:hypothetical protein